MGCPPTGLKSNGGFNLWLRTKIIIYSNGEAFGIFANKWKNVDFYRRIINVPAFVGIMPFYASLEV